jgi:hypothetical protein
VKKRPLQELECEQLLFGRLLLYNVIIFKVIHKCEESVQLGELSFDLFYPSE